MTGKIHNCARIIHGWKKQEGISIFEEDSPPNGRKFLAMQPRTASVPVSVMANDWFYRDAVPPGVIRRQNFYQGADVEKKMLTRSQVQTAPKTGVIMPPPEPRRMTSVPPPPFEGDKQKQGHGEQVPRNKTPSVASRTVLDSNDVLTTRRTSARLSAAPKLSPVTLQGAASRSPSIHSRKSATPILVRVTAPMEVGTAVVTTRVSKSPVPSRVSVTAFITAVASIPNKLRSLSPPPQLQAPTAPVRAQTPGPPSKSTLTHTTLTQPATKDSSTPPIRQTPWFWTALAMSVRAFFLPAPHIRQQSHAGGHNASQSADSLAEERTIMCAELILYALTVIAAGVICTFLETFTERNMSYILLGALVAGVMGLMAVRVCQVLFVFTVGDMVIKPKHIAVLLALVTVGLAAKRFDFMILSAVFLACFTFIGLVWKLFTMIFCRRASPPAQATPSVDATPTPTGEQTKKTS